MRIDFVFYFQPVSFQKARAFIAFSCFLISTANIFKMYSSHKPTINQSLLPDVHAHFDNETPLKRYYFENVHFLDFFRDE